MEEYHKIDCPFIRSEENYKLIMDQWRRSEYEYLANNQWRFTEKIDGTNVRVIWNGKDIIKFKGKGDNSDLPTHLLEKLFELFPLKMFRGNDKYPDPTCFYGEGFGARVQKGGGNYISDGVDFALFDVKIDEWWLKRDSVVDIAKDLGIRHVPEIGIGTLNDAIDRVQNGMKSEFGDFKAEGIVAKPMVDLVDRRGERIVLKIKAKDFQSQYNRTLEK